MANGQYNFSIGLNTQRLELDAKRATDVFKNLKLDVERLGKDIDTSFNAPLQTAPSKVEAATRSFNGLNVATQQLVRELPAASMGLNTLFLALSNNIPIFADQVRNLREEGESVGDIMSNIGKSLFSWQTALIAGVTLLSMYGKEIGNWVVSLFKGKEAVDKLAAAEKALREVRLKGAYDTADEEVKIRLTAKAMQDSTLTLNERINAMRTLRSEYPDYFANLTDEQMLYGDVAESVDTLIERLVALNTARAAINQLVENEQKLDLLSKTEGWKEFLAANEAFNKVGRKYEIKQQIGGRESDYVWKDTTEGILYDQAHKELLKNLKNGGEESRELFEMLRKDYGSLL